MRPFETEAEVGDNVIDCNVAAATVRDAVDETGPEVAEIVTEPVATPVARPALLIVASAVELEVQVTVLVRS